MPRRDRITAAEVPYHVMNHAWGRLRFFTHAPEYQQFVEVLREAFDRFDQMQLLAFCLMPNHWHLVLRPMVEELLSEFMQWVESTHTKRWNRDHGRTGQGGIYRSRFTSFPVEADEHLTTVMRYVERNALNGHLVRRAEDWRWGSLHYRPEGANVVVVPALECPLPLQPIEGIPAAEWRALVNEALTEKELRALRRSREEGTPFGSTGFRDRFELPR